MRKLPTIEEVRKMTIVGYWDADFFRSSMQSSGVILRDNIGREIKLSHAEIAKIRKISESKE